MLARTTDPERRAELEHALAGLEEARGSCARPPPSPARQARGAGDVRGEATRSSPLEAANGAVAAPSPEVKKQHEAEVKELQRVLRAAKRAEREAEKALEARREGPDPIGPNGAASPSSLSTSDPTPKPPGSTRAACRPAPRAAEGAAVTPPRPMRAPVPPLRPRWRARSAAA
jgi:hypothetical protein